MPFNSSKIQLRIVDWYLRSSQATMFHNSIPFFIHFKCSRINSNFFWHLNTPTDITDILTDMLQCTNHCFIECMSGHSCEVTFAHTNFITKKNPVKQRKLSTRIPCNINIHSLHFKVTTVLLNRQFHNYLSTALFWISNTAHSKILKFINFERNKVQ